MTAEEALQALREKFTSGNNIPVERSVITRDEWEAIVRAFDVYRSAMETYEDFLERL
jgi:lipoate-protein ligase A